MDRVVISGVGVFVPENEITNDELVESFNRYAHEYNKQNDESIKNKSVEAIKPSDSEFIIRASGIKKRWVLNKTGILNDETMHPIFESRTNDEMSLQCEIAVNAAKKALLHAQKNLQDIDAVILACSNYQRAYPALAIEVQAALGMNGFAYDMNVACASAAFAISMAHDMIRSGSAKCVVVINPEIYTGHLNFRDRSSHFIFGDAATAAVIEPLSTARSEVQFEILSCKLKTKFSNNIRNNFGFLNRCRTTNEKEVLFRQNGKNVREEVTVIAADHMKQHLIDEGIDRQHIKRIWLHQANIHMNNDIASNFFGRAVSPAENPTILSEYANTGAAGVMIAFGLHSADLGKEDLGMLCSFGAGYAVGSLLLKKLA